MSNLKHTPGPWTAGICEKKDGSKVLGVFMGKAEIGNTGKTILVSPIESMNETDVANSELIACAPEMLIERIKYYDGEDSNGNIVLRIPKDEFILTTERATGKKNKRGNTSQLKIQKCECGHKCCESYYVPEITSTGRMPLETAQKVACVDEMLDALIECLDCVNGETELLNKDKFKFIENQYLAKIENLKCCGNCIRSITAHSLICHKTNTPEVVIGSSYCSDWEFDGMTQEYRK